jgi:phage-Barnase-EndoU-ColicinE5/D-RelE like nuclease3
VSKISELVQFAKHDTTNIDKVVNLGIVPNFNAQEIARIIGLKINGAKILITASGIRHAIKQHGNNKEQMERGQFGILDIDFEMIQNILTNADSIEKGNDKRGKKSILFIKTIKSKKFHIAMSVHTSQEEIKIIFNTMYIKKES